MADIFLSYKREDRDKVRLLVEALQAQGWSVWWDNRIGAGETWDQVIESELRAAKCVLVVWSKRSIESDWVRAEAHHGRERKRLIPIILEGVTPPSIFRMIQATDLSSWKGERDDPNFSYVCAGVARLLRLDEATEPEPAADELPPVQVETPKPAPPSVPVEPAAAEARKHEPVGLASAPPLQTVAPGEAAPAGNVATPGRERERQPPDPRVAIAIAAAVALLVGVGSTYFVLSQRNAVLGATAQMPSGTNASATEALPAPSTTLSPQEAPRPASEKTDPPPPELPKSVPDAPATPGALAAPKPSANDLAIETQTRIIDKDPRNADAFLARGIAYIGKFEQDNAISDLNQAIEINPKSAAALTYRGLAYRRKGDNKRALAEYARAIAINDSYADAYNNRGYLKNSERDFDGARADFNKAISINGKYAEAYYGRGASYHGLLDYESAIRDFNKSIGIDDKNATYFNGRGVAYHDRAYLRTKSADDYAKAIADYSKAIDLNPNFAAAYKNRGFSRRMTNDLEGAISDYTKAIGINPRWAEVITWRGFAYELRGRSGDRGLAEADYLEALKIDPNYENAKRNLKDLRDKR